MFYNLSKKHINKIVAIATNTVFYNLHKISSHTFINNKYLYKQNLYDFYFLGETNKYVVIRGVVLKSNRLYSKYTSLNKCIYLFSIINNEYTYFQLPLHMPSLHF